MKNSYLGTSEKIREELNMWGKRKKLSILQNLISAQVLDLFEPFCDKKFGYSILGFDKDRGVCFSNKDRKIIRTLQVYLADPYKTDPLWYLKEEIFDFLIRRSSLLYIFLNTDMEESLCYSKSLSFEELHIIQRASEKWINERELRFPIIVDSIDSIDICENFYDKLKAAYADGLTRDERILHCKAKYSFPEIYKKEFNIL